jgi:acetylornithine deacetylase/succinyl-diaminopimelate desuccinylase-like protein
MGGAWPTYEHTTAPAPLIRQMRRLLPFLLLAIAGHAHAQAPAAASVRQQVRAYRVAHDVEILRELVDLLAIPNVASDSANIRRNAAFVATMLERRGIAARLLESPTGGPPAVYGELTTPGATRTVTLYAHYDGQPVDTTRWITPPWQPVLRDRLHTQGGQPIALPTTPGAAQGEWRLYARSAGDDKSPIVAMLTAVDALRAARIPLSVNVKFFFEGEEEAGSGNLRGLLERHAALLKSDLWLFGDGPVHQSRRQQVVFGVRGVTGLELTVYGPVRGLHSGHYGNWAPNPIVVLTGLLASMRAQDGRITIPDFYDDVAPISAAERRALRTVPSVDSTLRVELQLAATEAANAPLMERIMQPALNLRGIQSGQVGALASNTINTEARASIDFRLVPRQTPERIRMLVERHARAQGFYVIDREPTPDERMRHPKIVRMEWESGYPSTRTGMDLPVSQALVQTVSDAIAEQVITVPTLGGSLPMYMFAEVLRTPLVVLPIVNHDNNQHAANENLRLQNLFDGIEVYGGVLARLGQQWRVRP